MPNANKPWSEDDLQFLADNYGRIRLETIAKKLDRTTTAVKLRASRENIRTTDNFLTGSMVARILGADLSTVRRWIELGYLKAKKSKVVRRSKYFVWHIEAAALEEFLRDYNHLFDLRRISREDYLYWRNLAEAQTPKNQVPKCARAWSEEEDAFLLNNRKKLTYKELGVRLKRSKEAVHGRLVWLKKRGRLIPPSKLWEKRNKQNERDWTAEEDAFLAKNWRRPRNPGEEGWGSYITAEEIAKKLNRTKDGCLKRAWRLKITNPTQKAS